MEAAASTAISIASISKDQFFANGGDATPFLLMLYDQGRMPFSDRVPRESFVEFIREALARFPFTGTFESYIFILEKIFGAGSGVIFDVPAPGKLDMLVNAAASIEFDFIVREFISGEYVISNLVDDQDNQITASGISGIDSEYELKTLLSELIPAGIFAEVTLAYFALYNFVDDEDNSIIDHLDNQIVFIEN